MKQILFLIATAVLICAAAETNTTTVPPADPAFTTASLNLSDLSETARGDLQVGVAIVRSSNAIPYEFSLNAADLRDYNDGREEYILYLGVDVNETSEAPSYEAVVSV